MLVPNRLNLGPVIRDFSRSLRNYRTDGRDWTASLTLIFVPLGTLLVSAATNYVFPAPVALLPAVALLAGVLLAAAGQITTLRARIADSLTLSDDQRVTRYLRETMSGVILAAVAALLDALVLGTLAAAISGDGETRWWHVALSSGALALTAYLTLMFIVTARRLYQTYLEVFEGGEPLPRIGQASDQAESAWDRQRKAYDRQHVERGSL